MYYELWMKPVGWIMSLFHTFSFFFRWKLKKCFRNEVLHLKLFVVENFNLQERRRINFNFLVLYFYLLVLAWFTVIYILLWTCKNVDMYFNCMVNGKYIGNEIKSMKPCVFWSNIWWCFFCSILRGQVYYNLKLFTL